MPESPPATNMSAVSATPSERRDLDDALGRLGDRAAEFARLSAADRAGLLRECIHRLFDAAPAWVAEGAKAKGLSADQRGEEWLAGPLPTIRMARLLAESLDAIASHGRPPLGRGARVRDDGRLQVDLFPASRLDRVLFGGFSGYALMKEGIDAEAAMREQAAFYQHEAPEGAVSLVLGAGNVSSIPPMDAFTKMFIDGSVCLIKMNPVNEWVGPYLERALAPLITRGYLRIVYGGADVGGYLVGHERVDDIHITGSDRTHDLIVWGPPGPERDRRMEANEPLLTRPITSELGNVSPVAIVPYTYSDDELAFQARNVATMVVNNASFNCNAAKMLITSRDWSQREQFLELVARRLADTPPRRAYYPGAFDRYHALVDGREGVQTFGDTSDDALAWALIRGVDAGREDEPLFRVEPFCGILSETSVGSADPVEFLATATQFMNERLWGTLNAALIIHPKLMADATVGRALERCVAQLRYGTVAINHWPALCYGFATMPWGGHPGSDLKDIQSGIGWVHNTYMLGAIEKSVVIGPLKVWPVPPWFADNPRSVRVGPKLVDLEHRPSWIKLPGIVASVL